MLAALAGEGELRWDQPVRRVWPAFRLSDRWATREATFRDLTAGRSGLPAYAGDELRAFGYGRMEVLRRLRHLRPAAGFRSEYAPQDALVTAAAVAAERAAGASWARLVRERVLEPIGDDGTVLTWRGFVRAVDRATPHKLVSGTMVPQDPSDETVFAPSLGRERQPQRAGDLRPPAAQRRRGRRRAGGAGRAARADAAAGDGRGVHAGRPRGGRPRLDALQLRRPPARERRRRPRERLERRRDAAARRRRRGHRAGERVSRGRGPGQGARPDARRPRRARRAAGRLAGARADGAAPRSTAAGAAAGLALPPRVSGRRARAARAGRLRGCVREQVLRPGDRAAGSRATGSRSGWGAARRCATCPGAPTSGGTRRRGRPPSSTCAAAAPGRSSSRCCRSTGAAAPSSGSTDAAPPSWPPGPSGGLLLLLRPLMMVFSIMPKAMPAMAAPISSSQADAPVAATMVVMSSPPHPRPRHQPGRAWSPSSARALVTSSFTSRMPL